mgnify:CR=1 FL=1
MTRIDILTRSTVCALLLGALVAGAPRDAVVFNAGAAIAAFRGELDRDMNTRIAEGVIAAKAAIDSGKAKKLLADWVEVSQQLASV